MTPLRLCAVSWSPSHILVSSSQEKKRNTTQTTQRPPPPLPDIHQKNPKQKTKTHHQNKTLIEVNGMFTGAKAAKDLRTGEMQVNMKIAKWHFKG